MFTHAPAHRTVTFPTRHPNNPIITYSTDSHFLPHHMYSLTCFDDTRSIQSRTVVITHSAEDISLNDLDMCGIRPAHGLITAVPKHGTLTPVAGMPVGFIFTPSSDFTARDIFFFFFNDTATTEIYTLSLHDALPI